MVTPSLRPSSPQRLLGLLHPEDKWTITLRNVGTICQSTRIISHTTWLFSILVYHDMSAKILVPTERHIWIEHVMPAPIKIITITPRVHNSGQVAQATGFCTIMPNTCWAFEWNLIHVTFLRLKFWAGPYISGKSVHSCITQLQPIPALCTHQMEGSHIVSYGKKVCCVVKRYKCATSNY